MIGISSGRRPVENFQIIDRRLGVFYLVPKGDEQKITIKCFVGSSCSCKFSFYTILMLKITKIKVMETMRS